MRIVRAKRRARQYNAEAKAQVVACPTARRTPCPSLLLTATIFLKMDSRSRISPSGQPSRRSVALGGDGMRAQHETVSLWHAGERVG